MNNRRRNSNRGLIRMPSTCLTAPINAITACYGENKSIRDTLSVPRPPGNSRLLSLGGTMTALGSSLFCGAIEIRFVKRSLVRVFQVPSFVCGVDIDLENICSRLIKVSSYSARFKI